MKCFPTTLHWGNLKTKQLMITFGFVFEENHWALLGSISSRFVSPRSSPHTALQKRQEIELTKSYDYRKFIVFVHT